MGVSGQQGPLLSSPWVSLDGGGWELDSQRPGGSGKGHGKAGQGRGDGRASTSSALPGCSAATAAAGEDFEVPKALCHLLILVSALAGAGDRSARTLPSGRGGGGARRSSSFEPETCPSEQPETFGGDSSVSFYVLLRSAGATVLRLMGGGQLPWVERGDPDEHYGAQGARSIVGIREIGTEESGL